MEEPENMPVDSTTTTPKSAKTQDFVTCTIRTPPFSYAHLEVLRNSAEAVELDAIQVRSYCTAALKQFLGISGQAISIDILKVEGAACWLRIPRDDLSAFAAAITAWQGTYENSVHSTFRIMGCADWLGALVGSQGQHQIWKG